MSVMQWVTAMLDISTKYLENSVAVAKGPPPTSNESDKAKDLFWFSL